MSEPEPKPESRITLIVEHMSPRGARSVSPLSAEIDSAPTPLPVGRGAAAGLESKPSFDGADATPSISKPYYAAQSACPDMDMDVDVPAALDVPANERERLAKEKNSLGCHGLVGGLDIGIDGEMGGRVGGDEGETKVAVVVEEAKAVSAVSRKAETKEMVIPADEPRPKEVGGSSTQSVKARGKAKAKVRGREGGLKVKGEEMGDNKESKVKAKAKSGVVRDEKDKEKKRKARVGDDGPIKKKPRASVEESTSGAGGEKKAKPRPEGKQKEREKHKQKPETEKSGRGNSAIPLKRKQGDGEDPSSSRPKPRLISHSSTSASASASASMSKNPAHPSSTSSKSTNAPTAASITATTSSSNIPEDTDTSTSTLDAEIAGMLIESMATSRASSLPTSSLYKSVMASRPALSAQRSEKAWMAVFERVLREGQRGTGVFGKVESSGKVRCFSFLYGG